MVEIVEIDGEDETTHAVIAQPGVSPEIQAYYEPTPSRGRREE